MVKKFPLGMIFAVLMLAGCQSVPSGNFCDLNEPNRNPVEDMTQTEGRTALAHNLKGAKLCGWRP